MANLTPIRIAMLPKGVYSSSTAYSFLDVIYFNGYMYCCIDQSGTSAGQSPTTHTSKWLAMTPTDVISDGGNSSSF